MSIQAQAHKLTKQCLLKGTAEQDGLKLTLKRGERNPGLRFVMIEAGDFVLAKGVPPSQAQLAVLAYLAGVADGRAVKA